MLFQLYVSGAFLAIEGKIGYNLEKNKQYAKTRRPKHTSKKPLWKRV